MEETRAKIWGFIVDNFLFGDDTGLDENVSFLESGIVDSMGILEIIQFLREDFDVVVADEEMVPENLDSIDNLARYLTTKQAMVANS